MVGSYLGEHRRDAMVYFKSARYKDVERFYNQYLSHKNEFTFDFITSTSRKVNKNEHTSRKQRIHNTTISLVQTEEPDSSTLHTE